jgi:hypothetical protein
MDGRNGGKSGISRGLPVPRTEQVGGQSPASPTTLPTPRPLVVLQGAPVSLLYWSRSTLAVASLCLYSTGVGVH